MNRCSTLLSWICGLALAGPALSCEKSVRWNEDPPFSQRRADGEIVGLNVELVRETLRRIGCTVRWVELPWARALAELEAGRLDVLPGTLRQPERERYAYFSVPGPHTANVLFMRADALQRWRFGQLADLRGSGFRLGAQIGVSYGPSYDVLMRDPAFAKDVYRVSTRRSLWLMVNAGRLDGLLANELTARRELVQLGLEEHIKPAGVTVHHEPASVAFSKKTTAPEFVERYNRADEAMRLDGSRGTIIQRHMKP